jgi:predicted O-methyltransferase YrrM
MDPLIWRDTPVEGGSNISTSLTGMESAWLQAAAKGKWVLEVGGGYGYSSIIMARGAVHVFSIDSHEGELPASFQIMRGNLVSHGCEDRVSMIVARSDVALPALARAGAKFDLVFIDGNHDVSVQDDVACAIDLLEEYEMFEKNGLLAVHDYCPAFPEIQRVMDGYACERVVDTLWTGRQSDI